MGWLSNLFGGKQKPSAAIRDEELPPPKYPIRHLQEPPSDPLYMEGDGEYEFDIVGESHYQDALERIAGPKTDEGVEHGCIATLICENDNPYDSNAVAVYIDGSKVGHLSRPVAKAWRDKLTNSSIGIRPITVDALIVGGWDRGNGDEGDYGVKLDI